MKLQHFGRNVGFSELFTYTIVTFHHCIIHQEVLCAKARLRERNYMTAIVTKEGNLILARALHVNSVHYLLNEVESVYS